MSFSRRFYRVLGGAGAFFAFLGGCSTVVYQEPTYALAAPAVEREALARAASNVSQTKWPRPEGASFGQMLTGVVAGAGDRVTEESAAEQYILSLDASPARHLLVLADAEMHIAAAHALSNATYATAEALRPTMSDVSTVETAIGDLREARDVYHAALKRLSKDGEAFDTKTISALRAAFNEAIENVGEAADALADAVAEDRRETLADRSPRRAEFGGGF